jgi:undecaprenyl diphosphate synthase
LGKIDRSLSPRHVAIIMDGNGRWAKKRGLPKIAGHKAGAKSVEETIKAAREAGIEILTLYTFSTENWKRPKKEVDSLMKLLESYLDSEAEKIAKKDIKIKAIGRIEGLPESVRRKISALEEKTKNNKSLLLNLALNYGGRPEITDAAKKIAEDVKKKKLSPEDVSEEVFEKYLYTKGIPDPDLLIRTSGEMRLSNFLLWQLSYTEIYVTDTLWPDFRKKDLDKAITEFQKRERRYGS